MRSQYPSFRIRPTLIYSPILSLLLLLSACEKNGELTAIPTPETEPGRKSIRLFKFFEGAEFGDANFSAVLPDDWGAVDTLHSPLVGLDDPPTGILAKNGNSRIQVHYTITHPAEIAIFRVWDGYEERQSVIEGATIDWVIPVDPFASTESLRIDAKFHSLPGDSERLFGLRITAHGVAPSLFEEVQQIIYSVRFAPPPELQNNPTPRVRPGHEWQQVNASWVGESLPRFSVLAPPGTSFTPRIGLDSPIGTIKVSEIEILFELGINSGTPVIADGHIRYTDEAEQQLWVEVIHDKPFMFFRPTDANPSGDAVTGISVARFPGLPELNIKEGYTTNMLSCGGSFFTHSVDRDEQELVLAILRTIRAESQSTQCN